MSQAKAEVLQGTLDLMVLKTLDTLGPLHGYGIARRIEQVSENLLQMNQGTLYPALLRLQQKGWITSRVGRFGEQPACEILLAHQGRAETTGSRDSELGAHFSRGCPPASR